MSDPSNPSGALPGDPRYGLSEARAQGILYDQVAKLVDPRPVGRRRRRRGAGLRPTRRMWPICAITAIRSALPARCWSDDGEAAGSLTLLDAPDRDSAEAWIASEPYNLAGAFGEVEITRWSSSMEIRQLDYPRTEGWQQFAITAIDGPEADARRAAVAEDHHKFQASVMDRYVARGPLQSDDGSGLLGSFMIMEYPDRAACEDFWAKEPLNYGGVFKDVTIERWRYGKAVG